MNSRPGTPVGVKPFILEGNPHISMADKPIRVAVDRDHGFLSDLVRREHRRRKRWRHSCHMYEMVFRDLDGQPASHIEILSVVQSIKSMLTKAVDDLKSFYQKMDKDQYVKRYGLVA